MTQLENGARYQGEWLTTKRDVR
jgi:hypothetical protein